MMAIRAMNIKGFPHCSHILVGGLEHFLFFHILGIIIPTDYILFFRGVESTNQILSALNMLK